MISSLVLSTKVFASGSKDSINYMRNHLGTKGTVYVLYGQSSIGEEYVNHVIYLGFNNIKRLGGINRFDTNKVIVESMNAAFLCLYYRWTRFLEG